jgi:hypothetical protein
VPRISLICWKRTQTRSATSQNRAPNSRYKVDQELISGMESLREGRSLVQLRLWSWCSEILANQSKAPALSACGGLRGLSQASEYPTNKIVASRDGQTSFLASQLNALAITCELDISRRS